MATPVVAATSEYSGATAAFTHTIFPPNGSIGDLLFVFYGGAGPEDVSGTVNGFEYNTIQAHPGGSSPFALNVAAGGTHGCWWGGWKVATSATGTADPCAVSTDVSVKAAGICHRITGFADPTVEPPEVGNIAVGTESTADGGSDITPSYGLRDYLFISCLWQDGEEANDDTWVNSAPTNYGSITQSTSGTGGAATSNCSVATSRRSTTATTTDNPDTYSLDQAQAYAAWVVAFPNPIVILPHVSMARSVS